MNFKILLCVLVGGFSVSGWAINYTLETPSPDGRFALRLDPLGVENEDEMDAAIVVRATNATLAKLPNTRLRNYDGCRLVWTADSKRVAFTGGGQFESRTRVFFWNGKGFREIPLPAMPKPAFKFRGKDGEVGVYSDFITPVRWLKSGALLISREMTMRRESTVYEGKLVVTMAFTAKQRATIEEVKRAAIVAELF